MKIKDNKTAIKIINKVAIVTIVVNLVLAIGKFLAGIFGNSTAMISDAVHSSSDELSTIIHVSYTHLTLQTNREVYISGVAV